MSAQVLAVEPPHLVRAPDVDPAGVAAAQAAAAERERAAATAAEQRRRGADKARRRITRRRVRAARWAQRRAALRTVGPLVLITGCAVLGQVLWTLDHVSPPGWVWPLRLLLACVAAAATESIALNVQWHAHDAEVNSRHTSAVRLRRISYGIAALVAGINYSHFADDGLHPTPAAVMFALFSLSSPFLWGLHTRRIRDIRRAERGELVDVGGAVFLPQRWRIYPVRTFAAWRWSLDQGVTDPRAAWVGYHAARDEQARQRARHRATRPHRLGRLLDALIARVERTAPADAPADAPASPVDVAPAAVPPPAARADTTPPPAPPTPRRPRPRPPVDDDGAPRPGRKPAVSDDELLRRARAAETDGPLGKDRFRTVTGTGGDRWNRLYDQYLRDNHTPATEENPS